MHRTTLTENRLNDHGSFFVGRVDYKPLYPIHVQAMFEYFQDRLGQYRNGMMRPGHVRPFGAVSMANLSEYVEGPWLVRLSKQGFEVFYEEFVRHEDVKAEYPGIEHVPSPFAV